MIDARSLVSGAVGAGATVASTVVATGFAAGDRTVALAGDVAGRAILRAVEQALAWSYTTDALDLVFRSPAAEHAVDSLMDGPLVDAAAQAAGRHAVVERIAGQVLESPDFERVVVNALESEGVERLMTGVLESRVLDELVERLLASEDLWRLVDGIFRSPVVTTAVAGASHGLADEVAGEVRDRSRGADAWLERVARRIGPHHRPQGPSPGRLVTEEP
jgi:hypothetical protein